MSSQDMTVTESAAKTATICDECIIKSRDVPPTSLSCLRYFPPTYPQRLSAIKFKTVNRVAVGSIIDLSTTDRKCRAAMTGIRARTRVPVEHLDFRRHTVQKYADRRAVSRWYGEHQVRSGSRRALTLKSVSKKTWITGTWNRPYHKTSECYH